MYLVWKLTKSRLQSSCTFLSLEGQEELVKRKTVASGAMMNASRFGSFRTALVEPA
ncbi:hypothetical protein [Paracoccus sp. SY]|uniref:hypothetical protein n=1 Tax=Paracoccus sp. SY TaxID=1330255 RepID=UPI001304ED68|nr:hypothetical protein [Paracoccus sp. SY]